MLIFLRSCANHLLEYLMMVKLGLKQLNHRGLDETLRDLCVLCEKTGCNLFFRESVGKIFCIYFILK